MKGKTDENDPTYPAKFFAELFGITERRVQQLAKDEVIPKRGRGRYPLVGTVKGYLNYLQMLRLSPEFLVAPDGVLDPSQEKARFDRERWIYQEFKTEMEKGEYAPIELLGFIVSKVCIEIVAILENLPGKIKKATPGLTHTAVSILEKEIAKARNRAADSVEKIDDWLDLWESGGR
jgi:phage terminase Nu1 subunit (DNA packaging protein)